MAIDNNTSSNKPPLSIRAVFEKFLADFTVNMDKVARQKYAQVLQLFARCLNEFGYQDLDIEDSDRLEAQSDSESIEFIDFFGPEMAAKSLSTFLDWYAIRRIPADETNAGAAGTVTMNLFLWLKKHNYLGGDIADEAMEFASGNAAQLPDAQHALRLMTAFVARQTETDGKPAPDTDGPDHFRILKVEPGSIAVEPRLRSGIEIIIVAPEDVTELLKTNWEISGRTGRLENEKRFIEVANIFPL